MRLHEQCTECNGELKPKEDFFKQSGEEHFNNMKKEYEKLTGLKLELKGFNCVECGQCYDEQYRKQKISLGWLQK